MRILATTLLLAFALAQPGHAAKRSAAVGTCYRACFEQYAEQILTRELSLHVVSSRHHKCQVARTIIVGGRSCDLSCEDVWRAESRPTSTARSAFRAMLDADETAYGAHTTCAAAEPLSDGLVVMEHSFVTPR